MSKVEGHHLHGQNRHHDEHCDRAVDGRKSYTRTVIEDVSKLAERIPCRTTRHGQITRHPISYTSGTTGRPKGVMMHHLAYCMTSEWFNTSGLTILPRDVHFSYLPLVHVFERIASIVVLGSGGIIGFFSGSTSLSLEDIQALRPHFIPMVPRVMNRIYGSDTSCI